MDGLAYCICCFSKSDLQFLHKEILEGRWPWEQPTVAEMIFQCFNIKIEKDTGLNTICSKCVTKVRDALSFREQVICTIRVVDSSKAMLTMQNEKSEPLDTCKLLDTCDWNETNTCDSVSGSCDLNDPLKDVSIDNTTLLAFDQVDNVRVQVVSSRDNELEDLNRMVVFIAGLSKDEATRAIYGNKFKEIGVNGGKEVMKQSGRYSKRLKILEKLCTMYEDESPVATYKCIFCQKFLHTMDELVKHVSCEHKHFYNVKDLMNKGRIKYVTKKRVVPYKLGQNDVVCRICSKEFPHKTGLNQHMNEHYAFFLCGHCGKSFATEQRLKNHEKRHNPKEVTCGQCGLKFNNRATFYSHEVRKHRTDRKWHPCPECSERFDTYNQRVRHLASVHGRTEKRYKCTMCPKTFLSYVSLWSHKQKHTRRFYCEHCSRTFYKEPNLRAHQNKAHGIGEPVFVCQICNKSFATQYSISIHARQHKDM